MKSTNTILFLFSLVLVTSCERTPRTISNDQLPPNAVVEYYPGVKGLIKFTQYDSDDRSIVSEGQYLNGKKHGTWVHYSYPGYFLQKVESYHEGQKFGIFLTYDENGNLSARETYVGDKIHGQCIYYRGKKRIEEKYFKMGIQEGPQRKYYRNEKLMEEANYENGMIDGIATWYNEEGEVILRYRYDKGKLVDTNVPIDAN